MFAKLKDFYHRLTIPEVIVIIGAALILFAIVTYSGERFGAWRSERAFNKEKAQRLKDVQSALALADAANKKADAKENQADHLGQVNGEKASVATAKAQELEQKDQENMNAIETEYENTKRHIDAPADDCDRLRDACESASKLALKLAACDQPCPN